MLLVPSAYLLVTHALSQVIVVRKAIIPTELDDQVPRVMMAVAETLEMFPKLREGMWSSWKAYLQSV